MSNANAGSKGMTDADRLAALKRILMDDLDGMYLSVSPSGTEGEARVVIDLKAFVPMADAAVLVELLDGHLGEDGEPVW